MCEFYIAFRACGKGMKPRQFGRDILYGIRKGTRGRIGRNSFCNKVEAKTSITDARRCGPMVECGERERIDARIYVEGTEGCCNGLRVEIL